MRAIPAQRLLASYAATQQILFLNGGGSEGHAPPLDEIVAMSPAGLLPAVVAFARAVAVSALGDDAGEILEPRYRLNDDAALGVVVEVSPVNSSAQGVLRALLLTRGFDVMRERLPPGRQVDVISVTNLFASEQGVLYLLGAEVMPLSVPQELLRDVMEQASQRNAIHG